MNKKRPRASCLVCGKEVNTCNAIYCSSKHQQEYLRAEYIKRWLDGLEDGLAGITTSELSKTIRDYLFEINNNACQECGWSLVNPYTGKIPLSVHHVDGNPLNSRPENLQLLCPNCHSLTENYGSRNKGSPRIRKYKTQVTVA